jgi:hypothetical protein
MSIYFDNIKFFTYTKIKTYKFITCMFISGTQIPQLEFTR